MQRKRLFYLLVAIVLAGVMLAYSNHFENEFHFDDGHVIQQNIHIRSLKNIPKFFTDATTFSALPANQSYRPLLATLFALDYWWGGGKPLAFQVSAFAWYMILWALVFSLFRWIFSLTEHFSDTRIAALLASSFYILHTANAETVNYICARSDLLSTLFMVASLVLYISRPQWRKYGLYLIPLVLAMLSKEVSFVFPLLLLAYILLFEKSVSFTGMFKAAHCKNALKAFVMIAPACAVCLAFALLSLHMLPKTYTPSTLSRFEYILAQPFVLVHYFNSFLLPFNLSADTDWGPINNPFDDRVLVGTAFIGLLAALAFAASRRERTRPVAFGLIWFFIGVLPPSSGVVPLAEVMNDHRMFLPFIGLAMAASWGFYLVCQRYGELRQGSLAVRVGIVLLIAFVLVGHGFGTFQRNKVWKNEESLWLDVTQKSPLNGRGLMNYGLTLMAKGQTRKALGYFERALVLSPNYAHLHINIAIAQAALGDTKEAETHFKRAMKCSANYFGCYYYYARFLEQHGRIPEAVPLLERAVALSPGFIGSRHLLMSVHSRQRDWKALRAVVEDTLRISPEDSVALSYREAASSADDPVRAQELFTRNNRTPENLLTLSLVFYENKQYEKCVEASREALELRPDYALAYNNICSAEIQMGKKLQAVEACTRALEIDSTLELAKNNLRLAESLK